MPMNIRARRCSSKCSEAKLRRHRARDRTAWQPARSLALKHAKDGEQSQYPVGYNSEMKLNIWEAFAVLGLIGALFLILAIMFAGFRFFAGFSLLD
jgi:hypothetical protein